MIILISLSLFEYCIYILFIYNSITLGIKAHYMHETLILIFLLAWFCDTERKISLFHSDVAIINLIIWILYSIWVYKRHTYSVKILSRGVSVYICFKTIYFVIRDGFKNDITMLFNLKAYSKHSYVYIYCLHKFFVKNIKTKFLNGVLQ